MNKPKDHQKINNQATHRQYLQHGLKLFTAFAFILRRYTLKLFLSYEEKHLIFFLFLNEKFKNTK